MSFSIYTKNMYLKTVVDHVKGYIRDVFPDIIVRSPVFNYLDNRPSRAKRVSPAEKTYQ